MLRVIRSAPPRGSAESRRGGASKIGLILGKTFSISSLNFEEEKESFRRVL